MSSPALRRVVRRETHSSRTAPMIAAGVITVVALGYAGVEIVLSLLGVSPLAWSPAQAYGALLNLPEMPPAIAVTVGGALVVAGIALVLLAVLPGRRAKHRMTVGARAVVADNGVIAAAIARLVSAESGLPRDHVRVGVSHHIVDITLHPDLGQPVDTRAVEDAVDAELHDYALAPRVRVALRVRRPRSSQEEP